MEFLRRFLLIIFSLTAISTLMAPARSLYHIGRPDFARELRIPPYPWKHKGLTPAQFRAKETKDRILEISDKSWQTLLEANQTIQSDGYVKAGSKQLQNIANQIPRRIPLLYLKKSGEGIENFLRIRHLGPHDYLFSKASFRIRHPCSLWSPLLLIIGLLCYSFIPRRKFSEDTLCYGAGFSAVIGPDLVAWMMVSGFFTLGLGIGLTQAPDGIFSLFSSGLFGITFFMWLFTLFGFYMFKIAARYAGLGLRSSDGQIIRFSPSGTEKVSTDEIASVKLGHWQASKWLTHLGFLISIFNWRAMGPTLLNANRSDPQLEIHFKNGKSWKFTLTGVQNIKPVLSSLQARDIKLDSALRKMIT